MSDTRDILTRVNDVLRSHFKIPGTVGFNLTKEIDSKLNDLNFVTEEEIMENIKAILDGLEGESVRICEGGGPENLLASLAVTVGRMQIELKRLRHQIATGK